MRSWLVALCALAVGCRTLPHTPQSALDALRATPGAHLKGAPAALGPGVVLNSEDFVYDARASHDGASVAVARLGMKSYFLSLYSLAEPTKKRGDSAVNPYEFDVEMVEFSPDGKRVVTVSRDMAVRVFDGADAKPVAAWLTEEPLVSLAFDAAGEHLAVGSARGLITVLEFPSLHFVADVRGHTDEVRGLVFTPDGRLLAGGWDKRITTWKLEKTDGQAREARTHVEKKNGLALFRGVLSNQASGTVTFDARLPGVVVKAALAQAAGIDVGSLTDSVTVVSAFGPQVSKVAHNQSWSFKNVMVQGLDVAVCDACVPPDVNAVLGQVVLDRLSYALDESTKEIVLSVKPDAPGVVASLPQVLTPGPVFTFEAAVNDLTLDAAGKTLGVAFSETKSQRTREVYEREKRGDVEPERPWDCAARVDVETGKVLEQKHGHHGVVATAAISPDGQTLASGGWDKRALLHVGLQPEERKFGWAVRRVRFTRDGRQLVVAAWTPQNPLNDHQSDPSAVVYEVLYVDAAVER